MSSVFVVQLFPEGNVTSHRGDTTIRVSNDHAHSTPNAASRARTRVHVWAPGAPLFYLRTYAREWTRPSLDGWCPGDTTDPPPRAGVVRILFRKVVPENGVPAQERTHGTAKVSAPLTQSPRGGEWLENIKPVTWPMVGPI
jgi:hypothetical protein